MVRYLKKTLRILGWITAVVLLILALITLLFYIFRGRIKDEALAYFNARQSGELQVGNISFIPLLHFPDATVKIRDVQYLGQPDTLAGTSGSTILMIEDFSVSLDLRALIKGEYRFSRIDFNDGVIRLKIYEDGSTNIERALGELLEGDAYADSTASGTVSLDLERLRIRNLFVSLDNELLNSSAGMRINDLVAGLSYYPELIGTHLDLDVDVNTLVSEYYSFTNPRNLVFHGSVQYDQIREIIRIDPSSLLLQQTELEVWGSYALGNASMADLTFRARNSGLELLNFLLNGLLDVDELEQTGSGAIYLSGTIQGAIGKELPDIKINFGATGLGFRIKSINREVRDISFLGYLNNGKKPDLSEAMVVIDRLSANLPDGYLRGRLIAQNWMAPEVDIRLDAAAELSGLEKMLADSLVKGLKGKVDISAGLNGRIDRRSGEFLSDTSRISIGINKVSGHFHGRELSDLDGGIRMVGRSLFIDSLLIRVDSSDIRVDARFEKLLTAALGYPEEAKGEFRLASSYLCPAGLSGDSSIAAGPFREVRDLDVDCSFSAGKNTLTRLKDSGIPDQLSFDINRLSLKLPGTAPLRDLEAKVMLNGKNIDLEKFNGQMGRTGLNLSATLRNFTVLLEKDTILPLELDLQLHSACLYASDLFTLDGRFLLSEDYRKDSVQNLLIRGSVGFLPGAFAGEIIDPDLDLNLDGMSFTWSSYPYRVSRLDLSASRRGDQLKIGRLEGQIGKSDLKLTGNLSHFADSSVSSMTGNLNLESGLIDLDEILEIYYAGGDEEPVQDTVSAGDEGGSFFSRLGSYTYPDISLGLDVKKIKYEMAAMSQLHGKLRISPTRIFKMDSLSLVSPSGGSLMLSGHFNVIDPKMYILAARMELLNFNIKDINLDMEYDSRHYSLQENFGGILSAKGIAEFFITPDMSVEMSNSAAFLNITILDGEIRNFAPLHELARYFGNKDLDNVKFAELKNNFTLIDSRVYIPKINIGSTIGPLIIEGEQGFDNTYEYLLRLPPHLIKSAVWSAVTYREGKDREKEDEIENTTTGKFVMVTIKGDGENTEIKKGDQR